MVVPGQALGRGGPLQRHLHDPAQGVLLHRLVVHLILGRRALGHDRLVAETSWPKHDPALLKTDTVTIAVQVNGKRRGEVVVARDADNKTLEAAALAEEGVKRALDGTTPKKVIVVPGRIVNIVA